MNYYVLLESGPVLRSVEQLAGMREMNVITPETPVKAERDGAWVTFREMFDEQVEVVQEAPALDNGERLLHEKPAVPPPRLRFIRTGGPAAARNPAVVEAEQSLIKGAAISAVVLVLCFIGCLGDSKLKWTWAVWMPQMFRYFVVAGGGCFVAQYARENAVNYAWGLAMPKPSQGVLAGLKWCWWPHLLGIFSWAATTNAGNTEFIWPRFWSMTLVWFSCACVGWWLGCKDREYALKLRTESYSS
jgi:hypothetical protein